MLPKNRRIARKEFDHILKNGRRINSPHLLLYISALSHETEKTNSPLPSRFAFSISKKIQPHATYRNLYRRRGYAALSALISRIAPGYLFFFSFKKGLYPMTFSDIQAEVSDLLLRTSVLS